jgi:membrane protease subunit HflK
MILIICFSGIRFVRSGNVALIFRFGELVGKTEEKQIHEPGLLLAFPYIIDEVVMVPTGSVIEQKVTTHYTEGFMKDYKSNGYLITGDQNIAVISVSVKYKITDPVAYATRVSDMEAVVNASVSNAMVEAAANMPVDDILTSGKEIFSQRTIVSAQEKLDIVQAGITISNLELTKVSMPKEVVAVYNDVNAASVQASTILENAQKYMDTTLPAAEASANTLVSEANTYYSNSISFANQSLAEFWGVLEEYKANRSVVKARIYNEKISKAISQIGTVKVVQDGDSKIFIN